MAVVYFDVSSKAACIVPLFDLVAIPSGRLKEQGDQQESEPETRASSRGSQSEELERNHRIV
ncbi:hypothetical protein PILCRDRAFT_814593 [Piloderma croceum F 1598]|uniref:Uncharacterized protein n=1 Tax=Piloderma croceum (strain F 1598) TaxID=765440 RepID=A0A0C3G804_PILCF|nr:hypothetical protein PILCRDRAFT_814593 [Piloderma croceum F 1598]